MDLSPRREALLQPFFQSMCKSEPAFGARAGVRLPGVESAGKGSAGEGRLDRCARLMKERGSLSNRIRIRASLRMKDEVFEPGMFVRAHLPIPAACEQQSEIIIEKVFPAGGKVSPEDAPQRTICWETHMEENQEFYVEYSYVHTARYHDAEKMLREGTSSTCTQHDFLPMRSRLIFSLLLIFGSWWQSLQGIP